LPYTCSSTEGGNNKKWWTTDLLLKDGQGNADGTIEAPN